MKKRHCYLVFGGTTFMDREYKREYQNEYLAVDLLDAPTFIKRNRYITIIGNIIITTVINEDLGEKIDAVYDSTTAQDLEFEKRIQHAFKDGGQVRLRIEKDVEKAKRMRKQLSKNFYIPKELIEKHNLF
jgi:hypothetical protein